MYIRQKLIFIFQKESTHWDNSAAMIKGKKKDGKKKDAKKDGKKAAAEKAEESPGITVESSLSTLLELPNESVSDETQAIPEAPDKEPKIEEPPVQPFPPIHEESLLAQVIIKRYTCYKHSSEVKNSHWSICAVVSVIPIEIWLLKQRIRLFRPGSRGTLGDVQVEFCLLAS